MLRSLYAAAMTSKAIIPEDLQSYYDDWHMSPGLLCDGFVFFTGFTGANADGTLSSLSLIHI